MKLILIFIIFIVVSLGTSCWSSGKRRPIDAAKKGVLVGPNTPVYYLRNGHENLTIEKKTDVLKVSRSVSYYKSPFNFNNRTMFLRILVIVDYKLYRKNGEQGIIDHVVSYMSGVDAYFLQFENPSVKIVLAGIVITTHPDAIKFLKPLKGSDHAGVKVIEFLAYPILGFFDVIPLNSLHAEQVLIKMNRFLFNNKNVIDKEYDFHLILTSERLHTGRSPNFRKWIGYTYFGSVCLEHDNPSHLMPLGAIVDEPQDAYQTTGAHEIAHMLRIDHDVSLKCPDGYIMSKKINTFSNSYDWSECSKKAIQETFRSKKFSCLLKWPVLN